MSQPDILHNSESYGIPAPNLDLSVLVGREVRLFTEQLPGKEILTRVVSVHEGQFVLDSGSRSDVVSNLVHGQTVVVQFAYKGERLSVKAQFRRTAGGRHSVVLDDTVVPLSHRRFRRIDVERTVRLAAFPVSSFSRRNLSRLRWMETSLRNFSSGGASVKLPAQLEKEIYLLVSIDFDSELFPPLILAQVRHCYPTEEGHFHIGVEFVIREKGMTLVPASTVRELPPVVMSYEARHREALNKKLLAWTPSDTNTLE
jgi:hypothetical protein